MRAYPRAFWAIVAGDALASVGRGVLMPFWALYLTTSLRLSGAHAGALLAIAGLAGIVGAPLGGALTDRLGRRFTLLAGLGAGVLWFALYGAITDAAWLAVLSVFGITADVWWAAQNAAVADLLPAGRRTAAYGLVRQVEMAAIALGPPLGSLIALVGSLRWIFWVNAVVNGLYFLVVALAVPETKPAHPEGEPPPRLRQALHDRRLLLLTLGSALALIVYVQFSAVLGVFLHRERGYSLAAWGLVFAISPILIGLTQYVVAVWAGRRPPRRMLVVGVALEGAALFALWPTTVLPWLIAAVVVVTVGEMLVQPVATAAVVELAPPHLRGAYDAVGAVASAVAWPAGVLSGLALVGAGHGEVMLVLALPLSLLAALCFARLGGGVDDGQHVLDVPVAQHVPETPP